MSDLESGNAAPEINPALSQEVSDEDTLLSTDQAGASDEAEGDEQEEGAPAADDDTEEVELGGKKYRLPKELKPALMMQADYTRKTQELAEQRRAVEAEASRVKQFNEEDIRDRGRLTVIDDRLAQYAKVDWNRWTEEDFSAAQKGMADMLSLRQQRDVISEQVTQRERQALETQRETTARLIQEGQAVLARDIPGWGSEKATEVRAFGLEVGLSQDELNGLYDPRFVKILHAAMVGTRLMKQQQTAKPKSQTPAPVLEKVGRAAPAVVNKLSDKANINDWMKARLAQKQRANR